MNANSPPTHAAWVWGKQQWMRVVWCAVGILLVVVCGVIVVVPQMNIKAIGHGLGGRIAAMLVGPRLIQTGGYILPHTVYEAPDGTLHVLSPDANGSVEPTPADAAKEYSVSGGEWESDVGIWARTGELRQAVVGAFPDDYPYNTVNLAPDVEREIRRIGVEAMIVSGNIRYREHANDLIVAGSWAEVVPAPSGWVVNGLTVIGLLLFIVFLPLIVMDCRRLRRLRKGRCVWCAYDLRGLPGCAGVCPECGAGVLMPPRSAQKDTD